MNRKSISYKLLSCLLIAGLFCFVSGNAQAKAAKTFRRTTSSIMIDANSGDVISANNADERRYPASLTKLMTLYITFNALDKGLIKMDDKLPVSRHAANQTPSRLGLKPGEKIKVRDAVMALIVKSANDCAVVLAEGLGYSEENFAKTMTKVAHELGMKNTTFRNASGLPHREQKTTARDMAVLGAAIYHHYPQYYDLFASKTFTYQGKTLYTHNHLLKTFKGADGMKTGFTNAAGFNIVTSAERDGQRVIAVTMGHNTLKERDRKITGMMDKGLRKLALANEIAAPSLYAQAEKPKPSSDNVIIADNTEKSNGAWGIQVGAFSNYAKARNYALHIRRQLNTAPVRKSHIDIEPAQKGAAIVYRSKLIGFEKNEADKTCNSLKKSHKSCIVIASDQKQQFAMAENQ